MSHRNRESRSYSRSTSTSRSRSRSRSRSTSSSSPRDRDYRIESNKKSRNRLYNRRRSPPKKRERSRSPYSHRRSPTQSNKPSNKVILTSLPNYADKDVLNILLARQGYHPVDIRVVRRNTDSGAIRVFGFVEFTDISTAESWINFNQGYLKLDDGFHTRLEYSREEITRERQPYNPLTSDWTCAKCTINNFNRRTNCFKCGTARQESDAMEAKGYAMVGVSPCDTLLIRELPSTVTEETIRNSLSKYTSLTIQRVQIASSKLYAFVQMRSVEEAGYILQTFNKIIPYIDNCAVIITYSRQSLNQILIMENVNVLKSQSGISSASIHEDPTNSAAQLAHNAIQIAQMGRAIPGAVIPVAHMEGPAKQSVSTPFGYLPTYETPDPNKLQLEPSSNYYYDSSTGFYYDPKTEYYYNSNTNHWMFWSQKYNTYINCQNGDIELKKKLMEEERQTKQLSQSAVISAPPTSSQTDEEANREQQLKLDAQALLPMIEGVTSQSDDIEILEKKKRRRKMEDDKNQPKTPQEIQKEMNKWARRQEKVKMSFKTESDGIKTANESVNSIDIRDCGFTAKETSLDSIKKPWDDDDDDDADASLPADAVLPGRMRGLTNRQARVRMARADLLNEGAKSSNIQQKDQQKQSGGSNNAGGNAAVEPIEKSLPVFDEQKYISKEKKSCLLCRRQFPNLETLEKHVQMSNLHKTSVAQKAKELLKESESARDSEQSQTRYRDRAKERREQFGYDPGLEKAETESSGSIEVTEAVAAYKAATPLDETNVGNRMLKSMGWSEGRGLGRNLQGIVNPIRAEQHVQGVGLGSSGSKIDTNSSWKERNRKSAIERFQNLRGNEQ